MKIKITFQGILVGKVEGAQTLNHHEHVHDVSGHMTQWQITHEPLLHVL